MKENEMTEQGRRTAQAMNKTAEEWTGKAKGVAQEWAGKATEKARDAGAAADLYVREYAWTSVALAAVIGVVIGYCMRATRRS
jgi:ElaB/YqjD/DUF883 family membrane-anchored ribosome-binding protein